MSKSVRPWIPLDEIVIEEIQADSLFALVYLKQSLQDEHPGVFLSALRHVAKAHGIGMQTLADLTNLDRAGLYRALSEQGNPSFANLREILKALGFEISLSAIEKTG